MFTYIIKHQTVFFRIHLIVEKSIRLVRIDRLKNRLRLHGWSISLYPVTENAQTLEKMLFFNPKLTWSRKLSTINEELENL